MRLFLSVVVLLVGHSSAISADEGALTPEKAKPLLSETAGLPSGEFQKLGELANPAEFSPSTGDSLTWVVLLHRPGPKDPKNPTSFRFLGEFVNPAAYATAMLGPKSKDGAYRKYASAIHPEYITDCTCKVDGNKATGVVTFKAEKVYEGKVEYTAEKKDGKWRIVEFRLPDLKLVTTLGSEGKWIKK